jgi:hypothetical protein
VPGNASLDANLASVFDPFAQAKQKQSQAVPPDAAVMDSPFGFGMQTQPAPQGATTGPLPDMQQPQDFSSMAKQLGLQIEDLHKNPEIARLQLTQRAQQKLGPLFLNDPKMTSLYQAFDNHYKTGSMSDKRAINTSNARADRTLKALLGG